MNYIMKNHMEDVAKGIMDTMLAGDADVCLCERCQSDRMSYVLNRVRPRYVVLDKGAVYPKLDELRDKYSMELFTLIHEAAAIVKDNPKH